MPIAEVFKDFTIDCAHSLPNVPDGHKCKNVHGHTYKIRVVLKGEIDPVLGWVFDFAEIKTAFEPLKEILDHKFIKSGCSKHLLQVLSTGVKFETFP